LVASLLSGLKTPLAIHVGAQEFTLALALPFSWQLLWVSSMFFFVALVIYHWRCPAFVKKYHNFSEYQEYGHDPRWLAHEVKFLAADKKDLSDFTATLLTKGFAMATTDPIATGKNPSVEAEQTVFRYINDKRTIVVATPVKKGEAVVPDAERGLFWEIFASFSGSRPLSRLAILILLGLSAICFVYVLGEHVIQGFRYVSDWLMSSGLFWKT
jgi:hypothetical protein